MFAGRKWLHYLLFAVYIFELYYFYMQAFIIVSPCRQSASSRNKSKPQLTYQTQVEPVLI